MAQGRCGLLEGRPHAGQTQAASGRLGVVEDIHGEVREFTVELRCGPVHHFLVVGLIDERRPLVDVDTAAVEWATAQDGVGFRVVKKPRLFAHMSMQPCRTVGGEGASAIRAMSLLQASVRRLRRGNVPRRCAPRRSTGHLTRPPANSSTPGPTTIRRVCMSRRWRTSAGSAGRRRSPGGLGDVEFLVDTVLGPFEVHGPA